LTAAEFHRLADVPPEVEWYGNRDSEATKRAYRKAIGEFRRFTGIRPRSSWQLAEPSTRSRFGAWPPPHIQRSTHHFDVDCGTQWQALWMSRAHKSQTNLVFWTIANANRCNFGGEGGTLRQKVKAASNGANIDLLSDFCSNCLFQL